MSQEQPEKPKPRKIRPSQIADLKLAASKMKGPDRRSFQAAMAQKYCGGDPNLAERMFGWGRKTVELGLHELRTGITCLGAQSARCGNKLWEVKYPDVAEKLWGLAEAHAQTDPTFQSTHSFTRLTAAKAREELAALGVPDEKLPSPSCMADILNRNGYRLRPIVKAKPKKRSPKPTRSLPMSLAGTAKAERTPNT